MDEKQWKDFQNDIKKQVKGWVTDCLKESPPAESELLTDILYGETPDFIRGIEYVNNYYSQKSLRGTKGLYM
ncbi:pyruvate dehydrogenase e1 [Blastocystis sp. subtype 4]|uniref:pyruvate dehydrogenase e1 n=1 Tax=Blastocystis sp. subtype 4 TaxID=944170 RepID=UPI000711C702|nr:pyruvate dehydrogenase e1 [Blastocystis sp. subtype 4]KNB44608.1 pyruvate dehydrogenase e1 [Blastocystis sp. subtype 4]|eukprot:XP_014528053.1 pyruvate dehydrogenase e1 [Blastocystis sp. subtype 4]